MSIESLNGEFMSSILLLLPLTYFIYFTCVDPVWIRFHNTDRCRYFFLSLRASATFAKFCTEECCKMLYRRMSQNVVQKNSANCCTEQCCGAGATWSRHF